MMEGQYEKDTDRYHIQVLSRAISVLFDLSRNARGSTLDEVSNRIGLSRSTVFRILTTLQQSGLVERTEGRPVMYTLGLPWLVIAMRAMGGGAVMAQTQSTLKSLAATTGQATGLHVRWGSEAVCVATSRGAHPYLHQLEIGVSSSLCAGAAGKVLLAYLPYEDAKRICEERLPVIRRYPGTPSQVDLLLSELSVIRTTGYAISRAELTPDLHAVAVPVMCDDGSVVACVSVSGPPNEISDDRVSYLVEESGKAAKDVARTSFANELSR